MAKIIKPSTLPGFIEYLPGKQLIFNGMLDIIERNFQKFGFFPLDTPVLEKEEVLLAKGGGDTDKEIYRFTKGDTAIAMRFDLTVPLARYVAEHYNDLSFPFRRYHIAKVYRGERAQRGRYREFYQCDIDIIGNERLALSNDAEVPALMARVFEELEIGNFTIRMNHRKLLRGFFEHLGIEDATDILRILDKLEKIGWDKTRTLLEEQNLSPVTMEKIREFISLKGTAKEVLGQLKDLSVDHPVYLEGIGELETIIGYMEALGVDQKYYTIDVSVARGLDYYTGVVYETTLDDYPEIGSICSGGRYDDLAGYYTKASLPGVGMSIGLSRLFSQLEERGLLKEDFVSSSEILIIPMDDFANEGLTLLKALRDQDHNVLFYGETGKLKKKFKYADDLNIPFVIVIGEEEVRDNLYTIRDMKTGDQVKIPKEEISCFLREKGV